MADPVIKKLRHTAEEVDNAVSKIDTVINNENKIDPNAIPSGAITGPKLGANSVTTGKIAPGTIEASDINQSAFDSTLQEKGKLAEAKVVGDKFKEQGDSLNDLAQQMDNILPRTSSQKRVVVIGDSISTFSGWIPSGYETYYPNGSVVSVEDTWWKQVIDKNDAELVENLSYSGSCACPRKDVTGIPSLFDRVQIAKDADLYIVALGTNDSNKGYQIGTYSYDSEIEEISDSTFANALIKSVKYLKKNHPKCNVMLISFVMTDAFAGCISKVAETLGCYYQDVRSFYNYSANIHPDKQGMASVASNFNELKFNSGGFFVIDKDNNIGMQYDENGLDAAKINPHFVELLKSMGISSGDNSSFIEVKENGFFVVDNSLNVGLNVNNEGIHAKNIFETEIIN